MSQPHQAAPLSALEAITEAQKIAFAPMLFQACWSLRETGLLAYLDQATRAKLLARWNRAIHGK